MEFRGGRIVFSKFLKEDGWNIDWIHLAEVSGIKRPAAGSCERDYEGVGFIRSIEMFWVVKWLQLPLLSRRFAHHGFTYLQKNDWDHPRISHCSVPVYFSLACTVICRGPHMCTTSLGSYLDIVWCGTTVLQLYFAQI